MFCRQGFERSCKGFMLQDECRILFIRKSTASPIKKMINDVRKKQIKICFNSTDFNALSKALQRLTNGKRISEGANVLNFKVVSQFSSYRINQFNLLFCLQCVFIFVFVDGNNLFSFIPAQLPRQPQFQH